MTILSPGRNDASTAKRPVSLPLFVGFTVAAAGGPLALAALFVPGAVSSLGSIGLISLLAVLVFVVPILVWLRYSEHVASSGGLFSFVEAAAGRKVALIEGGVWIISYALYLSYTIDYITYDLLPAVTPGIRPYRSTIEIVLPVVLAALGFMAVRNALRLVAALAIGQIAVLILLAMAGLAHVGIRSDSFGAHGSAVLFAKGTGNLSLLFICSNLSLYLGGETEFGSHTVRRGLPLGFGIAAAAVVLGDLVWARASRADLNSPIPGAALAQDAWGHWFGVVVGLGVAASVAGVVIAEYFALSRLVHAMFRRPQGLATAGVAVFFVATSAIALVNPTAFYDELIKPSLVALWVSQLVVFVVFPRFANSHGGLRTGAIAATAVSLALMGYGLYSGLTLVTGS